MIKKEMKLMKMKKASWLLLVTCVVAAIVLSGCTQQGGAGKKPRHSRPLLVPASSGNPYEVMVVAEDSVWDGYAGRALRNVLGKPLPMLPQEEPMFHVSHVTPRHFDRITHLFRNVIVVKVNPHYSEPKLELARDVYASPQLILTIEGPSAAEISTSITEHTSFITRYFSAEEINREATRLEDKHNIKFDREVEKMFGCHLYIPVDLRKMKVCDNFIWASNDGVTSIQNICIYSYPYVTQKVFNRGVFIALRDSFMRNIPGEHEGSVMSTNAEWVQVRNIQRDGHFVEEARGLWEMTKEAMGGPFVSHSQVDTVNNRVIVVEGFVYAPDKMKRTMVRRLEAALYTLQLPGKKP